MTIPVEAEVAAAFADPVRRAAIGHWVSRVLRPGAGRDLLADAIADMKAQAKDAGLTDEAIDEELAAYNLKRRG